MAQTEYKAGSVIFREGEPIDQLSLITKGEVEASLPGSTFRLEKADMIGLCDIGSGTHSLTYTAISDTSVVHNNYEGFGSIETLVRSNADLAYLIVKSMCYQITECLCFRARLKQKADSAYELIQGTFSEYGRLSKTYASTPRKLPGLQELTQFFETEPVEEWIHDYYTGIKSLDANTHQKFFYGKPGISLGFLHKSADDVFRVKHSCRDHLEYLKSVSALLLSGNGLDLISFICDLHLSSINIKGADQAVEELAAPLIELASGMEGIDPAYYQQRIDSYKRELTGKRENQEITDAPVTTGISQDMLNSLEIILSYSGCDEELCDRFRQNIQIYTDMPDRNSTEDEYYDMRKALVAGFYELYKNILMKTINDPSPPTVIKMFLKFGYVDPTLAGYDNANFLFSIADSYEGNPDANIYTISEWLIAVYKGKFEPSLSEFEMDYQGYVRELKNEKRLDDAEVKRLLADQEGKLRFEMENVFPVVNRVTFGNPSRFCPVFSEHNLQRKIENLLVTPESIKQYIDEIRSIDFTAFYRETQFADQKAGVIGESINVEVLPNIILMPNAGVRGSMWQEIEGRLRTTPARIFMPICLENDLKQLILRLTGEFRWEMCKRIQGSRWGDVTDPSLTSFYTDYLQFYMNNRSISMQTMNAIRNELSSARNNYKTVFVTNYAAWIVNESTGSARLNNLAIAILMQFCPFNAEIRERLSTNMRYNEALTRYNIKQKKHIEHVARLIKSVKLRNKEVPKELLDELEFARR